MGRVKEKGKGGVKGGEEKIKRQEQGKISVGAERKRRF